MKTLSKAFVHSLLESLHRSLNCMVICLEEIFPNQQGTHNGNMLCNLAEKYEILYCTCILKTAKGKLWLSSLYACLLINTFSIYMCISLSAGTHSKISGGFTSYLQLSAYLCINKNNQRIQQPLCNLLCCLNCLYRTKASNLQKKGRQYSRRHSFVDVCC